MTRATAVSPPPPSSSSQEDALRRFVGGLAVRADAGDDGEGASAPQPPSAGPSGDCSMPSLAVFWAGAPRLGGPCSAGGGPPSPSSPSSRALEAAVRQASQPVPFSLEDASAAARRMGGRALGSFRSVTQTNAKNFFEIQISRHRRQSALAEQETAQKIASAYLGAGRAAGERPVEILGASIAFQLMRLERCQEEEKKSTHLRADLTFNLLVDVNVHGSRTRATVTAPGRVNAWFSPRGSSHLERVSMSIDAHRFVRSLRNQSRALLLNAISSEPSFRVISDTHGTNAAVAEATRTVMNPLTLAATLRRASDVVCFDGANPTGAITAKKRQPSLTRPFDLRGQVAGGGGKRVRVFPPPHKAANPLQVKARPPASSIPQPAVVPWV